MNKMILSLIASLQIFFMSIGYANDSKVHKSFALPKESKEIQGEFYVKGGTLPPKTFIILGKDIFSAIINKDAVSNLTVNNYQIEKSFPLIFYKNGELKCGILAKDAFINGVKFAKGHFIEFDQKGKIIKQKNDFPIDVDKIFNEDGLRPIWDDNCFFREVESKKVILFFGIKWLSNTKMIFSRIDESIIMPRKFFARAGQQIEDQVLKHDSTILFCRRKKDDVIVIKSVTSSSFDDFVLNDDGGNQCPW